MVLESMQLHIVDDADAIKTRKTSGAGGKPEAAFQICSYDNIELPYPDAKVAEKLCIGGACCYYYLFPNEDPNLNGVVLDDTIGNHIEMMKMFILTEVCP